MATNNPNLIQQTVQQPIILQQAQPMFQQTAMPKKRMVVKSLNWSKKKDKPLNSRNLNVDTSAEATELFKEVRENLSHLRQLNNALMSAEHFDINYKKENQGKTAEYKETLLRINELSRKKADENTIVELNIISDALALDRAYIDAIFPQIIETAMYMNDSMSIEVSHIHYEDLHEKATVALERLNAIEAKLSLEDKVGDLEDQTTSISSAILIINNFDDMQERKQQILALKEEDQQLAKNTTKNFLIGIATIIIAFFIITFTLYIYDIQWKDFKDNQIPSIGIPLGVCIWSFIGSFAAMLIQFYKKPIHEFGNTLKWVIIRPILGVVMGAAIYLALYSLVLTGKNQNELLPFLVAFFVGYSDTFTFTLLKSIQDIVINLFTSSSPDSIKNNAPVQQPVYVVAPTQPAPEVTPIPPVVETPPTTVATPEVTPETNPPTTNPTINTEHTNKPIGTPLNLEDMGISPEDEGS